MISTVTILPILQRSVSFSPSLYLSCRLNGPGRPKRHSGSGARAYFSKIFNGCPLHLTCAAAWTHPGTKSKLKHRHTCTVHYRHTLNTHTRMHACTHAHTHTHTHTHTQYTCTHTHTHIQHTRTHTHMHTHRAICDVGCRGGTLLPAGHRQS